MTLSEHELQQLQRIETDLTSQDPQLAAQFDGVRRRVVARSAYILVGLVGGVLLVLCGLRLDSGPGTVTAVLGYLFIVAAVHQGVVHLRLRNHAASGPPRSDRAHD